MEIKLSKSIFNDAYFPSLVSYIKRYEIYYGGAGSGKSHFIVQKLIIKAVNGRRKILCLRKIDKTVNQSVFQLLKEQLSFFHLLDKCSVNKTNYTIELPNGSQFICCGLQDSERIKSIAGITDIWMEEASEFLQSDFNQLDLRLRHPTAAGQQIYLSFNPVSKVNWTYKLFFNEDFESIDEKEEIYAFRAKCSVLHTTYLDNKFLPQPYIDSLLHLKVTNPDYYGIYALGQFGSLGKMIYTNWSTQDFDYTKIDGKLLVGLDFGFITSLTALTCALLDEKNKRIYIFDEFGKTGLVNSEIAEMIKDKRLSKEIIVADSAEQKSIEEIKRLGIQKIRPCKKGADSVIHGIQKLQQYELIVHPRCKGVIEDLVNYCWKKDKKTEEYINEPDKQAYDAHYLDALRYSLQCVKEHQQLRTIDKNILF